MLPFPPFFLKLSRNNSFNILQGSEIPYMFAVLFLILFPVACGCAAYLAILVRQRHSVEAKRNSKETGCLDWFCPIDETGRKLSSPDCLTRLRLREWISPNHYKTVYLRLIHESKKIETYNRRGDKLRSINLNDFGSTAKAFISKKSDKKNRYF